MSKSVKDWRREGAHAFKHGVELEDCPYEARTTARDYWREGWIAESEKYE